ncbi:MAG TPA: 3',5'-cyclic-nucleotide phosphodiesterase [Gemmatimonadetes bacterium]|nr:3',5'-cyclic-nucleotide phosphodiesterase [Gemmatimonadota bacterium]
MLTVLHGSDVHFGRPHRPVVAGGFVELARRVAPDVIVLAGDFTQRARVSEFEQARAFLRELQTGPLEGVPVVVTPGNHDVPLFRIHERMLNPFRNYRAFISKDLDTVTRVHGAVLVALNSADPHRGIVNGRITDRQLEFLARIFQETSGENVRILVVHHNVAPPPDGGPDAVIPRNGTLLDRFRDVGVDLILSGHLHRGFVTSSAAVRPDCRDRRTIPIVHSGTASSGRGRAGEKGENSVNVLKIDEQAIEVVPHWFQPEASGFVARENIRISRS